MFFTPGHLVARGLFMILLLCHLSTRITSSSSSSFAIAAAGLPSDGKSSSTSQTGGVEGGGGRRKEKEEEEDEDVGTLGDRSAQIIRQQDAEEGRRREEEEWTPLNTATDWNKDDSLCKKPSPPENGYIKGDNYNDGGVVRIFCEPGYTLKGPSKLMCVPVPHPDAPGVWLPQDEYHCLPSEPKLIEIRTLEGEENQARPGYTIFNINLHGTDRNHQGRKTQTFTEETIKCPKPTPPQHGRLEGTDYSLYATVRVTCDEGYHLIGPDHITCLPVPDPFHRVGIWEPQHVSGCHAPPPMTLPLILSEELSLARGSHHQRSAHHRHTDTLPDASRVEGLPTLCSLPKVVGPCRASIPRYYFNTTLLECLPFIYGGCHGNDNNFETFPDCQKACR